MSKMFVDASPGPSIVPDSGGAQQILKSPTFIKAHLLTLNSYSQYLRYWSKCWEGVPEYIKVIWDYSWRSGLPWTTEL